MGANSSESTSSDAAAADSWLPLPEEIRELDCVITKLAYCALCERSESKATDLAEAVGIPHSTIYTPLYRLEELGAVERRPALHGNGHWWRVSGAEPNASLEINTPNAPDPGGAGGTQYE